MIGINPIAITATRSIRTDDEIMRRETAGERQKIRPIARKTMPTNHCLVGWMPEGSDEDIDPLNVDQMFAKPAARDERANFRSTRRGKRLAL